MSLINDMLRDLEARRAGELARPGLQREIRTLPDPRRSTGARWIAMATAVTLVVSGGGWAWWQGLLGRDSQDSVPVSASADNPPAQQPAAPAAVSKTLPDMAPAAVSEALRLATTLESLPTESAAVPAGQTAERADAAKAAESSPAVAPAKAVPALGKVEPASRPKAPETREQPGSIEKTVVVGSPREKAEAEYRRAQGMLAAGQVAGVQDALIASLKQDATYVPARQALLRAFLESRRVDEAMVLLNEGLELQPAQVNWAMSLARLTLERGDMPGAERVLSRHAQYAVGNPEYAGFHGHLLYRMGQYRSAAERYQAASRLAPADGRWWFGLGQALESEGHGVEAREAFRRALASGSLNSDLTALAEQKIR